MQEVLEKIKDKCVADKRIGRSSFVAFLEILDEVAEKCSKETTAMEELVNLIITNKLEVERLWVNAETNTISCRLKNIVSNELYGFYVGIGEYINSEHRDETFKELILKLTEEKKDSD